MTTAAKDVGSAFAPGAKALSGASDTFLFCCVLVNPTLKTLLWGLSSASVLSNG